MDEERPLDPDPVRGNAPHCEVLVDSTGATPDDDALEDLDSLPVAFDDLGVDAYRVAGAELRNLWLKLLGLELTNDLGNHLTPSFSFLALAARSSVVGERHTVARWNRATCRS